jgi:hypothetical protein
MGVARREHVQGQSGNKPDYQTSFVDRIHRILSLGYARLDGPTFAESEEEDITGELARAMQAALEDASAPGWAKHFWPHEETRIHEPGRLGKRRRRVDVEIIQCGVVPRPRFRFEAKRLHDAGSQRAYLGDEGLGRFLGGRYAKDDEIAGMLGYVQRGPIDHHATSLAGALEANREKYHLAKGGGWAESPVVGDLPTFRSIHYRAQPLPPITLLHTLLLFC